MWTEHGNDLPSELVSIDIYRLRCNFNWYSKLPASLKSLNIDFSFFNPDWDTLPPQLEELKLKNSSVISESLARLPQSLKTLELSELRNITSEDDFPSLLPKNLTRISISRDSLSHSVLQHLPVTLTDFEVVI